MRYLAPIFLLTGIFPALIAFLYTVVSLQAGPTAPPTPILLSNHQQTNGDVGVWQTYYDHIVWTELNGSEGMDLFYSAPPFTQTIRLSDLTQTEGSANYMHTILTQANDGVPHVIWLEETGTSEGYDLFYWTPVSGTLRLTDRNLTEGDPELGRVLMDIQIDENGRAHVIWNEVGNDGNTQLWFYWNQANNTTQTIPGFSNFVVRGAAVHVVWREYYDGSPHYWNSADQTDVAIPYTTGSAISGPDIFVDNSGTVYVYWGETFTTNCLNRWNAATQTTEGIISGSNCLSVQNITQDKSGRIHATGYKSLGGGNYEAYYWNSSLTNELTIQTTTSPDNKYLYAADNGTAYVRWEEGTFPNGDMYYWDSVNQTTTNLSAGMGSNTPIGSYSTRTLLTADGRFHIAWLEGGTYYLWQSDGNVQNLYTKFDMSVMQGDLIILQDEQNNVRMAWRGTPTNGSEGLFFWDETTDAVQHVWTGVIDYYAYALTPDSKNHLAWTANNQAYYWNEADGETNLTVNSVPDLERIYLYSNSLGNVSLWWKEESSTAAEGIDLYAAWEETSLNQRVYLPLVTR